MAETPLETTKEARAIVRYLRISPRKVRPVINAIRTKPVNRAFAVLMGLNKKAARFVEKGLKSAVANAKVKGLEETRLLVSEIKADGGPVMKRFMSRSMGKADEILKRTTHLTVAVREGTRSYGPLSAASGGEEEKQSKRGKSKAARQEKTSKKLKAAA